MQRVKDETGKALFQQVPQNSEAVMSGGFEPCFYVFGIILERGNDGKEFFEALTGIGTEKGLESSSPSWERMQQSCLSLETSMPRQIMESSPSWELILCEDTTHLSAVVTSPLIIRHAETN